MEFDFVTWSIWAIGFAIWVVWVYYSVEEFKTIVKSIREKVNSNEASSGHGGGE